MLDGGPLSRRTSCGVPVHETDHLVGTEELPGDRFDVRNPKAGRPPRRDSGDDLGFAEARVVGAQADLGVDEAPEQLTQLGPGDSRPRCPIFPDGLQERVADWQADCTGFAVPAVTEMFGGEVAVLGRAGGNTRRLVGDHPGLGVPGDRAPAGCEVGFDLRGAFGERPQLGLADPGHLPAPVAIGAPPHPQPLGQPAAQLLLIHASGRLRPVVERGRVQRHPAAVVASHQARDHRVRMQLRVARA